MIAEIAGEQVCRDGKAAHTSGVRAAGDGLTIKLTSPSPDFLERLPLPFFCVVPTDTPIVPEGVAPAPPTAGPYYMAWGPGGSALTPGAPRDLAGPLPVLHYIAFNAGRSLFSDRRLRLAVARGPRPRGARPNPRDDFYSSTPPAHRGGPP